MDAPADEVTGAVGYPDGLLLLAILAAIRPTPLVQLALNLVRGLGAVDEAAGAVADVLLPTDDGALSSPSRPTVRRGPEVAPRCPSTVGLVRAAAP